MAEGRSLLQPDYAVPPGETIRELIDELGMTQAQLASRMGRSESTLSQVINGKKRITEGTALQLERVLGMPAGFWSRLEANYRMNLARRCEDRDHLTRQAEHVGKFPYAEMARHGWVPDTTVKVERAASLLRFFGVDAFDRLPLPAPFALRVGQRSKVDKYALAAWLRRGWLEAQDVETALFDSAALEGSIAQIRRMSRTGPEEFRPLLTELLASCGVALVVLPHIHRTYAQGATQWLGRNKVAVQLTLRYAWADIFWFSLLHEIGHTILHRGERDLFVNLEGEHTDRLEREADEFAAEALVPNKRLDSLLAAGRVSVPTVKRFAAQLGIAPGILVGRLQSVGVLQYSQMNHLREKYIWADQAVPSCRRAES